MSYSLETGHNHIRSRTLIKPETSVAKRVLQAVIALAVGLAAYSAFKAHGQTDLDCAYNLTTEQNICRTK